MPLENITKQPLAQERMEDMAIMNFEDAAFEKAYGSDGTECGTSAGHSGRNTELQVLSESGSKGNSASICGQGSGIDLRKGEGIRSRNRWRI